LWRFASTTSAQDVRGTVAATGDVFTPGFRFTTFHLFISPLNEADLAFSSSGTTPVVIIFSLNKGADWAFYALEFAQRAALHLLTSHSTRGGHEEEQCQAPTEQYYSLRHDLRV